MDKSKFVHLHLHTEYSLLDGFARIDKLFQRVKELNMDTVAITDHGVMFGAVEFYKAAKKHGVKPIIGCEVYVASRSRFDKVPTVDKNSGHLILLAQNKTGYQNLIELVSKGYTEGFYYKPRIDYELLEAHAEGLIGLSACLAGDIPRLILNGDEKGAEQLALRLKACFAPGNFYLELQDHGLREQHLVNQKLIAFSNRLTIPLVATNDVHYLNQEDVETHDILLCIQTGKTLSDRDRIRFPSDAFYLKSPEEMRSIFGSHPEALENTLKIAEKCNFDFDFDAMHLPAYQLNGGETAQEKLITLCTEGLYQKYSVTSMHLERMQYELDTIHAMGYDDYFLIVWDFIKYAKELGIFVGPGRGSCGGSLVAYILDITEVDPLKYDLIFERFLNPERVTMPDIDIDFEDDRRGEVIDYVIQKYGKERVAQIITFGTMAARAAIRDVGRVMDIPYQEVDRLAKEIPMEIGMTLERALHKSPKLNTLLASNVTYQHLMKSAIKLEGIPRHASTHAAGIVISKESIDHYVPLYVQDDNVTTQFNMNLIEELGLLKMDFLGLRTLTVIKNALKLIEETQSVKLDLSCIPYDDAGVYQMIGKGDTLGLFQLESAGFRRFMRDLKPTVFEDIIAGISLYRPGPMDSIPMYIRNKNDHSLIQYKTERLKSILDVTYGCLVYQEQVMRIVRELAGYSYGRSDIVRRAMSKKKMDVMARERQYFVQGLTDESGEILIQGCKRNGIDENTANSIFDEMIDFAKYAFNKSHAAGYAIIAYQTAYLKYHWPTEFMAALMTSIMGNHSKLAAYIQDAKDHQIKVLPPSVNHSMAGFSVENGTIRYGLNAIKNVGRGVIEAIIKGRTGEPFKGFYDFCERVDVSELNKKAVESLIKSGAFDELGHKRSQMLAIFERVVDGMHALNRRGAQGQVSIFNMENAAFTSEDVGNEMPDIPELRQSTYLQFEKEMLGIYLTGHPLEPYKLYLEQTVNANLLEIKESIKEETPIVRDGDRIVVGGLIADLTTKLTKHSQYMAFLTLEDLYEQMEIIVFPKVYDRTRDFLKKEATVLIHGRVTVKEDEDPKLVAEQIVMLDELKLKEKPKKVYVKISGNKQTLLTRLNDVLAQETTTGKPMEVIFYVAETGEKLRYKSKVKVSRKLLEQIQAIVGEKNIKIQ